MGFKEVEKGISAEEELARLEAVKVITAEELGDINAELVKAKEELAKAQNELALASSSLSVAREDAKREKDLASSVSEQAKRDLIASQEKQSQIKKEVLEVELRLEEESAKLTAKNEELSALANKLSNEYEAKNAELEIKSQYAEDALAGMKEESDALVRYREVIATEKKQAEEETAIAMKVMQEIDAQRVVLRDEKNAFEKSLADFITQKTEFRKSSDAELLALNDAIVTLKIAQDANTVMKQELEQKELLLIAREKRVKDNEDAVEKKTKELKSIYGVK